MVSSSLKGTNGWNVSQTLDCVQSSMSDQLTDVHHLNRNHVLTPLALWTWEVCQSRISECVGKHDLKCNTYLSSMKSVSCLSCRQTYAYIQVVTRVIKHYVSELHTYVFTLICVNRFCNSSVIHSYYTKNICTSSLLIYRSHIIDAMTYITMYVVP